MMFGDAPALEGKLFLLRRRVGAAESALWGEKMSVNLARRTFKVEGEGGGGAAQTEPMNFNLTDLARTITNSILGTP